jgi:hypothetical protein
VLLDPNAMASGVDNIIETAANWIQFGSDQPIAKR